MAVTTNSNVKQENKAFQKEEINSFNTSTYGRLQINETNNEILFNIVGLAAAFNGEKINGSFITSQAWSPTFNVLMTGSGQGRRGA
jgi:hypothetical protein